MLARDAKRIEDVDTTGPDHGADAIRYGCLRQEWGNGAQVHLGAVMSLQPAAVRGHVAVQMTQARIRGVLMEPQGAVAVYATSWGIIDGPSRSARLWPSFSWLWREADMRVGYFGYYLKHRQSGDKYIVDLRNFVRDFVRVRRYRFQAAVHLQPRKPALAASAGFHLSVCSDARP